MITKQNQNITARETYMFTWRTEPFTGWNDKEGRPQARSVVTLIALITKQNLQKIK